MPRLTNLFPKASELAYHLQDDECDHGFWPHFKEQALDLTLCVIRQFTTVDGKEMLNRKVRPSLTGFDLNVQQSSETSAGHCARRVRAESG